MQHKDDSVVEAKKAKVKLPPMYKVLLLNDDYTPMEFVVLVLQKFFGMTRERATQVMLKVHREGMGVCGVYPHDVASTKVQQVAGYARKHQHPLQCVMEETLSEPAHDRPGTRSQPAHGVRRGAAEA